MFPRASFLFLALAALLAAGCNTGEGDVAALRAPAIFATAQAASDAASDRQTTRAYHTATRGLDGGIYLIGGRGGDGREAGPDGYRYLDLIVRYDPATGRFREMARLRTPRIMHSATLLSSGAILIAGGFDGYEVSRSVEVFEPDPNGDGDLSDARVQPGVPLSYPRAAHGALRIPGLNRADLRVDRGDETLLVGGITSVRGLENGDETALLVNAELYEPVRDELGQYDRASVSFRDVRAPRRALVDHSLTLMPARDGDSRRTRVLVFGGRGVDHGPGAEGRRIEILSGGEIYDPFEDRWTLFDPPAEDGRRYARRAHGALLLSDGRVLVAGGTDGDTESGPGSASSAARRLLLIEPDLRDPQNPNDPIDAATLRIRTGPELERVRRDPSVASLARGQVLAGGGYDPLAALLLESTEIYDEGLGSLRRGPALGLARSQHTTSSLAGDGVVLLGGLDAQSRPVAEPEGIVPLVSREE